MITSLSDKQIARFPEFIEKWVRIGLSTDPADRREAEAGVIEAYKVAGLSAPRIVWCGSPLSQGLTRALVFGLSPGEANKIRASVGASVRDSVGDSVRDSVGASVRASVRDSGYGQHDATWLAFYDYFRLVCEMDSQTQKLCGLWRIAESAGWWLPHKNICWISERHGVLNRNAQGRLHKDGGPAVSYPDGWSIFALNGVRVKEEYAVTPAEVINPATVFAESNAEVRRELIRKIGVERFLAKAPHKILDRSGDYQLLSVELSPEVRDARYLKMLNPSVGCWHVEGVDPSCSTVQHAINWRATRNTDSEWSPSKLT